MTIEDFVLYSDDHFESHLLGNGLYLLEIVFRVILSPSPPTPMTLQNYPLAYPLWPVFSPQATTIGGGPPPWIMGARRRHLRLARGGADSVCLRARPYLHHASTRPRTRPPTHTTPLNVTTLHSHLPSAHNTLSIVISTLYSHLPHTHTPQHIIFLQIYWP